MTQKFCHGDHVQVAKDLGPHMSHFPADCEAIVIGSYKDHFDLRFHEMDKVNVTIDGDGISFQPKDGGLRITVLKDWR